MEYTRQELRKVTGLPDKSLRYLLEKLDIQPIDFRKTLFGSPVFVYDESALQRLHEYIFVRNQMRLEFAKGKRCRGGCNQYLAPELLNSEQICPHCRRRKWLLNEVCHNNPSSGVDAEVVGDIAGILGELSAK